MYDYVIVGAGLYGSVFANYMKGMGKTCLVLEKRQHIGGNVFTQMIEDIHVHRYGAHIFHTSNKKTWEYVNSFTEFNNYINSPLANYKGEIYNLPFNMNTFYQMWKTTKPADAKKIIDAQRKKATDEPKNLEEQAIRLVGRDIYEKLIKGYTQKQWGRPCNELPASIIKRLPVRMTYDNNYFNDVYQGIPKKGYTHLIKRMLDGIEVRLNTDFLDNREYWRDKALKLVYTGQIDEFFDYKFGQLEYRSLRFEDKILETSNYQGNAVVNYTDSDTPYTRIIEHKHFDFGNQPKTVISMEYSEEWTKEKDAFYPVNNDENNKRYERYKKLADKQQKVLFGGRLGEYRYLNMDQVVEYSLERAKKVFEEEKNK